MHRLKWPIKLVFLFGAMSAILLDREMYHRLKWYIKQPFFLRYESRFKENGKSILCQWRMWGGRCFNVRSWELANGKVAS